MKRIWKITLIATLILIIGVAIIFFNNKKIVETSNNDSKEPEYIWSNDFEKNSWFHFRKAFEIDNLDDVENVIAKITVDSRYWLYINGEIVQRDGSLKRGANPDCMYYDEVDITDYLKEGKNIIAVLAWYWGKETSYSYNPYTCMGLYFDAQIGNYRLVSDDTWKVSKAEAYLKDEEEPDSRLAEYNILYDANFEDDDWYSLDCDDSDWEKIRVVENTERVLEPRDIPLFKHNDLKEYDNFFKYRDTVLENDEIVEMVLPYNMQITPYFKIEAQQGKKITIYTDTYDTNGAVSLKTTYITKEGEQEFESLSWINGEKIFYCFPAGTKIISLKYRETGYDTELAGSFECDDEFYNSLWKKARRTLYVNMRDNYMDCPNRERAQWSLDMANEMIESMYGLDENSYNLYKHGIRTIIGWEKDDALYTVVPSPLSPIQLPIQTLLLIDSIYEYYEYTGDIQILLEVYPYLKNYLKLWQINEYGILQYTSYHNAWEWKDSSEEMEYKHLEYVSYYMAENAVKNMACVLEYNEDVIEYTKHLKDIKKSILEFWNPDEDIRITSLGILSGVLSQKEYYKTIDKFKKDFSASPAMERYVLEALCEIGEFEIAETRMKTKYFDMIEGENACSTLWEHWEYGIGSTNHAWSSRPTYDTF